MITFINNMCRKLNLYHTGTVKFNPKLSDCLMLVQQIISWITYKPQCMDYKG